MNRWLMLRLVVYSFVNVVLVCVVVGISISRNG